MPLRIRGQYQWHTCARVSHGKRLGLAQIEILLVLAFTSESKLVLWLSIWDFVDSEPLICGPQKTGQVSLDIFHVIELWCQGVVDVNDNDFPVSLFLVEKSHNAEYLDLLDLAGVTDSFTNLTDIQWVVVALCLGLWMDDIWVLPGLWACKLYCRYQAIEKPRT